MSDEQNANNPEIKVGSRWQSRLTGRICDVIKSSKETISIQHEYPIRIDSFYEGYAHISDPEPAQEPEPDEVAKPSPPTDEDHGIEFGREYVAVNDDRDIIVPDLIHLDKVYGHTPNHPEFSVMCGYKDLFLNSYLPHNWTPAHVWKDGDEAWWVKGMSILYGIMQINEFGKFDFNAYDSPVIFFLGGDYEHIYATWDSALEAALKEEE